MQKLTGCVLATALLCTVAVAQGTRTFPHQDTVNAYIEAFNSGEEARMSAFFADNVSATGLQQTPIAQRVQRYRGMHEQLKSLKLESVPDVQMTPNQQAVTTLMLAGSGEKVKVRFLFEPQPPNKLVAITITEDEAEHGGERPPAERLTAEQFKQRVASYLEDASKQDRFSGVIVVVRNGETLFQGAYGYADRQKKAANRLDTKFNVGSMNKAFTRMAIEQLVAAGKLSLDDTIGKWLPGYPNEEAREKVTVRQLLEMSSGIGDFFGERYREMPKAKLRNVADYVPLFADKPLLFPPGTQQRYSNGGYIVLGLIIEKASGQSYYDYVKQHICDPAGMNDTDFYFSDEAVPNRAEGYTKQTGSTDWTNNEFSRPARGSSAGGGYSTAADLLKFTQAIAAGKLPGEHGGMALAGGAPGVNAMLLWESGYTIVVLSNLDPPSAEQVANRVHEWISSLP